MIKINITIKKGKHATAVGFCYQSNVAPREGEIISWSQGHKVEDFWVLKVTHVVAVEGVTVNGFKTLEVEVQPI